MSKILIVYASKHGQSEKISNVLGKEFSRHGQNIEIWNVDEVSPLAKIESYDGIIIGGSVHKSKYSKKLISWTKNHASSLRTKPTAFFSVCLGILQKEPEVQKDEDDIMQTFFCKTGWDPTVKIVFAGAITYSKYNWLLKRIMRSIAKKAGTITDIRQDYEYTDWNQVRQFANSFVANI